MRTRDHFMTLSAWTSLLPSLRPTIRCRKANSLIESSGLCNGTSHGRVRPGRRAAGMACRRHVFSTPLRVGRGRGVARGTAHFVAGGRRFASLAPQVKVYGNLTLTLEQQAAFVEEAPENRRRSRPHPYSGMSTTSGRWAGKIIRNLNKTSLKKEIHRAGPLRPDRRGNGYCLRCCCAENWLEPF